MLATHPAHFSFFYENPSIRTTETRFYEPERLSTPRTPQTVVFTKTAGRHNLAQVFVVVNLAACYIRSSVLPSLVAT